MKPCVLILPYFGKFNNYFQLFLNSIEKNPSIELLIFTDSDQTFQIPKNVYIMKETFQHFSNRIKKKISPEIQLNQPYKLCDFKPTYGYVLSEFIKQYCYWGYCDCDLVFGNLQKLLLPLLDQGFDKIFALGHLTLYKNTEENNTLFMRMYEGRYLYKDILFDDNIGWFDEDYKRDNIHSIFLSYGKKVYGEDLSVNPNINSSKWDLKKYDPESRTFLDIPYKGEQYYWDDGNLIQVQYEEGEIIQKEYMYMHLQSRKMKILKGCDHALTVHIVPNRFIPVEVVPSLPIEWKREKKFYLYPQKLYLLIRRLKKKIGQ